MQFSEDNGFKKLMELKDFEFEDRSPDSRYSNQLEVLTKTLEFCSTSEDPIEQPEFTRIAARFDPIAWDLVNKYLPPSQFTSYSVLLKACILALRENRKAYEEEYHNIIHPQRWGNMLELQHLKYEKFVSEHMSQDYYTMIIVMFGLIFIIASFILFIVRVS